MTEGAGNGTTLRLALGMRGGVSLAVWIGGAAAELDELRCAPYGSDASDAGGDGADAGGADDLHRSGDIGGAYYRALLGLGGYSGVQIDVMSGASAGGLNAVLAASAMIGRRRVAEMRETWLRVAALRELLESREGDDGSRRSLLGGSYFTTGVQAEVRRLLTAPPDPDIPPLDHRLEVFLSATVHHGIHVQIEDDDYSPDAARRAGGLFHFRHLAATASTSDLVGAHVSDNLARAARTTASFPTAFEPVRYTTADLPGVLLLPARPPGAVWLLDGGIVDNIPVARAIEGIPSAPAIDDTDRWLIYLQPSPDSVPAAPSTPNTATTADTTTPSLVGVARALVGAFMSETILDDVEVLRQHNVDAIEAANAWQVSIAALDNAVSTAAAATVVDGAARAFDATRIHALLLDPLRELRWRPIAWAIDPAPLGAATSSQLIDLRDGIAAVINAHGATVRPFAALVRTAALLTGWARSVQRAEPDAARQAGVLKLHCYQLMQLAQVLTTHVDLAAVAVAARQAAGETVATMPAAGDIVGAMAAAAQGVDGDPDVIALVGRLPVGSLELAEASASDEVLALLYRGEFVPSGRARNVSGASSVAAAMWAILADTAWELAHFDEPRAPTPGGIDVRPLRVAVLAGDPVQAITVLRMVDELTVGVHHGAANALPSHLQYLRIAGSNASPLSVPDDEFEFDGPRFTTADLVAPHGAVPAASKLAGVSLANFSAFISERWRANDWMWGRLDAAKSIVDVVTSKGRLGRDHAALMTTIEALVTAPFHAGHDTPPGWAAEIDAAAAALWQRHRATVADELTKQSSASDATRLTTTKRLLVLRRHWELLATELPGVLRASLRPEADPTPAPAPASLAEAIDQYQASPRSFNDVWGMRWSTALGIRAAYELWAATRPRTRRWRMLRAPLKPLPMSALGTALSRNRGLLAMALSYNLVLMPRIRGLTAWLVFGLGLMSAAILARLYRVVLPGSNVRRPERFAHSYQVGTVLAFAAGVALNTVDGLRNWLYRLPAGTSLTHFSGQLINPYTWLAGVAAFVTTAMLWCWARTAWRLLGALVAAVLTMFWAMFSRLRPAADAGKWIRLAFSFSGMMWALVVTIVVTTSIAHFAFRRNWQIAEYGRD
ncbi:MAG: patatin-like protein [Ilumatobacteraceae bacterium]